jgi:cysteine synthase
MRGAIERAQQIARETQEPTFPISFRTPSTPGPLETTGPEIAAPAPSPIDAFVAGVGTTGRSSARRGISERVPSVAGGCRAPGSILGGGERGPHKVEGVGLSFLPEILDRSVIDEVLTISDDESFETCRTVARSEGLLIAGSSGAAAAGALRVARRLGPGKVVVTIFPDAAERYPNQGIFERSG